MNVGSNLQQDLTGFAQYQSTSTQEEVLESFQDALASTLEDLISGYNRAALEEAMANEEEEEAWESLLKHVDNHIETVEEQLEEEAEQALESRHELELLTRKFMNNLIQEGAELPLSAVI